MLVNDPELTDYLEGKRSSYLVFFDIETGGTDQTKHPLTEIAAVAVNVLEEKIIDQYHSRILFKESSCEPEALKVQAYDKDLWHETAFHPKDVAEEFAEWLHLFRCFPRISKKNGSVFLTTPMAGHNASKFDGPFLHSWYKRLGLFCPADFLMVDTLQLVISHFVTRPQERPDDYKLLSCCQKFGIDLKPEDCHNAISDVEATVHLWAKLVGLELQDIRGGRNEILQP